MSSNVDIPIHREPIFSRVPISFLYPRCVLCSQSEDCYGVEYSGTNSFFRKIHIPQGYRNWASLKESIQKASDEGFCLRLVTDQKLPQDIIWAASYSEKNIIQANLNMLRLRKDISWVESIMITSNKCGVYCILHLSPIIPSVVPISQIIEVLDRFKSRGYFHANIRFYKSSMEWTEEEGFVVVNDFKVPLDWMSKTSDGWECSKEFISKTMKLVQEYAEPRKLSVSVCGEGSSCTGLNEEVCSDS